MRNTAIQTLLGEHREFTFGHIEPTAMLRRIVKFQLPRDPACFCRGKGLIQRGGGVGIEVIHDQSNYVRLWKMHVDQLLHLHGEVMLRAACCDVDVPPPTQRLDEEEEICRAFAAILIIVSSGLSRPGRQGVPCLTDQLHRTFLKTDLRTPPIIRLGIQIQHILHVPDKVRTDAGNAPFFALPRLEVVFFSTRRTVSSETASTSCSATRRSASNCMVQRFRPVGGVLQASATKKASCLPSNFCRVPGRLRSVSALARPSSTNRCRVRWTVEKPTRKVAAISSSVAPSAAWSSIWARATLRADGFPCLMRWHSSSCSSAVKSTIYLFAMCSSW